MSGEIYGISCFTSSRALRLEKDGTYTLYAVTQTPDSCFKAAGTKAGLPNGYTAIPSAEAVQLLVAHDYKNMCLDVLWPVYRVHRGLKLNPESKSSVVAFTILDGKVMGKNAIRLHEIVATMIAAAERFRIRFPPSSKRGGVAMAILPPYFSERTDTARNNEIWIPVGLWTHQGDGRFSTFSQFRATFTGNAHGHNVSLDLQLLDQQPAAPSGPCSVTFNGHVDGNARYTTDGSSMVIGSAGMTVTLRRCEGGRETELVVHPPLQAGPISVSTIHLKPV